jgi:hypothetical protein
MIHLDKTIETLIKETLETLQSEKVSLVEKNETCSGILLKTFYHNYTKVALLFVVILVVMFFLLSP